MSGILATGAAEGTRRRLTARQAGTVRRLTEAGVAEIRRSGYENLSIRDVARRAGVAAATAYTYFGSKDHLLAEIFWRRLSALPPARKTSPSGKGGNATRRADVIAVLRELALLVSGEPELAAGCTAALFGSEPDVRELRLYIGRQIHERIEAAAGRGSPEGSLLELAFFGAMVEAGLGYSTYEHVADRLADAAELIMD
jgi:AcrR family transcriptional regulator